ncbi:MAG: hypothetical protein WCJ30_12890 [Deltaproteobacteria bacterium]
MRTSLGAACATTLALVFVNGTAHAGGFEYPENGSIAMGRGGAYLARASDPSSLMLNTAGMMGTQGVQITLSSNFAMLNHCFQRAGGYQGFNQNVNVGTDGTVFSAPGGNDYAAGQPGSGASYPYPQVCNAGSVFPAPQILATWRINRYFAVGIGVYGPNSVGRVDFPSQVTVGNGVSAPSPNRYMLLGENLLILHPTIALAGSPFPWLRVGVGLQPSFAQFEFATMANAVSGAAQSPDSDIQTKVTGSGFFFAFNAGIQLVAPRYFTFGAHMHYNPETVTLSGRAEATGQIYSRPAAPVVSHFDVERMVVHLPLQVRWGVRFALPRSGSVPQDQPGYHPMKDDVFDLEVNWIYERSSVFSSLELHNRGNIQVTDVTTSPAPANLNVPHDWHDVFGVRVGGDVNIIPNRFALRAGVSYELGAQSHFAGQLDIPAYTSLGLHAGLSVRFAWLTISAAYAHMIMPSFEVYNATGRNLTTISTTGALADPAGCAGGTGSDACHTNVGTYTASIDTFNIGFNAHF